MHAPAGCILTSFTHSECLIVLFRFYNNCDYFFSLMLFIVRNVGIFCIDFKQVIHFHILNLSEMNDSWYTNIE